MLEKRSKLRLRERGTTLTEDYIDFVTGPKNVTIE
jgi:hypothetical protein